MKKLLLVLSVITSFSFSYAGTCVDLPANLNRGAESDAVLLFQNFLYEKGYLKAKPNGYFGVGTFAAVKAYQRSLGLSQVGNVGPGTRAALKKETCNTNQTNTPTKVNTNQTTTTTQTKETLAVSKPAAAEIATPGSLRNAKRKADIEVLLKALSKRYTDTKAHSLKVTENPIELCVKPAVIATNATATEVAVLVTPKSPCEDYVDIAYLSPSYIASIPRDPTLATSSVLTGYMITRSEYNDITISPKTSDDKAIIKVACNFNTGCSKVEYIATTTYSIPVLASIDKPIFLKDSVPKTPTNIIGKGFTLKNKVYLLSSYSGKEYYVGEFAALSSTTIAIPGTAFNASLSCGVGCSQKLSIGDYALFIKNEGGISNNMYLSIKGFSSSSSSARSDSSVTPKTTNVKLGTIVLTSSVPLNLMSLTLKATSSKTNLPGKITKFVLKDSLTSSSFTGSGLTFNLTGQSLYENQSKLYDVYADVDEVYIADSGFISYGATFLVKDILLGNQVELPVPEFSFTVSY